jgi:hypothetical protein
LIERGFRAGLPGQTELRGVPDLQAHRAAAQWAVTGGPGGVH